MSETIELYPIGYVQCGETEGVCDIVLEAQFTDGLEGVEDLEYVWVLFWMHELDPQARQVLRAPPLGDVSRERQGVFSLHSPMRPNPIGLTRAHVVARQGNRLIVEGLDARDGSPVLDIKSG